MAIISAATVERVFSDLHDPKKLAAFADRLKRTQEPFRALITVMTQRCGEDVAAVAMLVASLGWAAIDPDVTRTISAKTLRNALEKVDQLIVEHKLARPTDATTLARVADVLISAQPHLATMIAVWIWHYSERGHVDVTVCAEVLREVAAVIRALEMEGLAIPRVKRKISYEAVDGIYETFANDPSQFQPFSIRLLQQRPELEDYLQRSISKWTSGTRVTGTLLAIATLWRYFDEALIIDVTATEIESTYARLDATYARLDVLRHQSDHPTAAQIFPEAPELARVINDWIHNEVSVGLLSGDYAPDALMALLTIAKLLYDKTAGMVTYREANEVIDELDRDPTKREICFRRLIDGKPGLHLHLQTLKAHLSTIVFGATVVIVPAIWQCLDPESKYDVTAEDMNFAAQKIRQWTDQLRADGVTALAAQQILATQPQLGVALHAWLSAQVIALNEEESNLALKTVLLIACALDLKAKDICMEDTFHFVPSIADRPVRSAAAKVAELPRQLLGYVRESGAACTIDLDVQQLAQQLKEIINGPFDAIVRENVTPGAHFVQFVGRSELSPSVWLRTRLNARGASAGSRKVLINGKRTTASLTRFVPAAVSTLLTDDDALIEAKFYVVQPANAAPSVQTGAVDAATHEAIVANYLGICERLNSLVDAVEVVSPEAGAAERTTQDAERIWPSLRDAVIFELSADAYVQLYEEFAYYIARSAKVSIHPSESLEKILDQLTPAAEKRVTEMVRSGAAAPFPEKLPFKSCFFAYGAGVNETERLTVPAFVVGADTGTILGHLVCESGEVVRFAWCSVDGKTALQFESERLPGQFSWAQPHNLAPWIVNALVDYVNEHKTLIEMGKIGAVYRTTVKKIIARLKLQPVQPPPFYVVYMKDNYVRETGARQAALIKRHIDWQHRWKVRGHDCIRFQRGPLPIDPELLERFARRGYKVFTDTLPDAETFADLHKRGVPEKGPDEWIAILKYWREPYEKGPDDKPLIESVRRSTKKFDSLPDDVN